MRIWIQPIILRSQRVRYATDRITGRMMAMMYARFQAVSVNALRQSI